MSPLLLCIVYVLKNTISDVSDWITNIPYINEVLIGIAVFVGFVIGLILMLSTVELEKQ